MTHILLYVPNIIGYFRLLFMVLSWYFAFTNQTLFLSFYAASYLLDMADGYAARLLKQSSSFGALLDMVTDRLSSAGMFVVLAMMYEEQYMWWFTLLAFDIGAHWL